MGLGVFCIGIMDIIGSYQFYTCLLTHPQKLLIYQLLLGQSVVLKLQEEISFSKDFLVTKSGAFRLLIHAPHKISCNFSRKAST